VHESRSILTVFGLACNLGHRETGAPMVATISAHLARLPWQDAPRTWPHTDTGPLLPPGARVLRLQPEPEPDALPPPPADAERSSSTVIPARHATSSPSSVNPIPRWARRSTSRRAHSAARRTVWTNSEPLGLRSRRRSLHCTPHVGPDVAPPARRSHCAAARPPTKSGRRPWATPAATNSA